MTVKAKQKGIYSCLHVTEDTTAKEHKEFIQSTGDNRKYSMDTNFPYWIIFEGDKCVGKISDEDFNKKYEVVE